MPRRHIFEHYIWSIRHNAGIILIFLQHNGVVSENCEKCMQILPGTRSGIDWYIYLIKKKKILSGKKKGMGEKTYSGMQI